VDYCTQIQLEARYGTALLTEISDRADAPTGTIDAALITRAITDATALIDGYLAGRYALPLATIPALVTDLAQRIAIYYAHSNVASEKIGKDYEAALRQLKDIASGLIKLDAGGAEPAGSGASEVRTNEPERPLSAATMKGFV
jgi:phage gp36-like protein